jgi:acetyl/propionyl-CoA carboxylase alpha subunit
VKPIRKLLVANRGEIARRIFRTCRARGIATVAVFSEPDRDARFVAEADEAVALGGTAPAESYLRGDAVVAAAARAGADAVHPGYGFLAENAEFARLCVETGLAFVGPPPEAIAAMGGKLAARELARAAGVPVLPAQPLAGLEGAALSAAADSLGWPVLVKAAAGGGGRGMRVVREEEALAEAVAAAGREAASAFGDGTVFLERFLPSARHVEVQVFGDAHGNLVSLFERECSIQRRHQKILEEAPSPAVNEDLRAALGAAAVAVARAVAYVGAGTVEFLLTPGREFFFLEMNTRLQVEHPVTEAVTGLDLVALQIHVAEGGALPPEACRPAFSGHAIEARLYAEDPERGFLPSAGTLHRFRVPDLLGLRVESGVADGSPVDPRYDPLLAKLIAHAPTRAEAAARLAGAVSGLRAHGVTTNRELLIGILRHPNFLRGEADTGFLERHPPSTVVAAARDPDAERLHAAAAALAASAARRASAPVLGFLPSGWRNNPSQPQEAAFDGRGGRIHVRYRWERSGLALSVGGAEIAARVHACGPDLVDLETDGVRRRYEVHRVDRVHYVDSPLGHTPLREVERLPSPEEAPSAGSLRAPLPGRVVRLGARAGDAVEAGAVLAVLEAMKMEHQVTSPRAGRVTAVLVDEGQTVEAGAVLAVVEPAAMPFVPESAT